MPGFSSAAIVRVRRGGALRLVIEGANLVRIQGARQRQHFERDGFERAPEPSANRRVVAAGRLRAQRREEAVVLGHRRLDHPRIDHPGAAGVREQHRVVAQHVDAPRDSAAVANKVAQRSRLEDSVGGAVDRAQPLLDVFATFGPLQGIEHGLGADTLLELAQRRIGQPAQQLGLSDENEVELLFVGFSAVRQQPQLLHRLVAQPLRLVHHYYDALARLERAQEIVHRLEVGELAPAPGLDPELLHDDLHHLFEGQLGIAQVDGAHVLVLAREDRQRQRGLARPDLADQDGKAARLMQQAPFQGGVGLPMLLAHVELGGR